MPRDHLTVADLLGMRAILVKRFGGGSGARDPGALDAALFRPQTGYCDEIGAEAAAPAPARNCLTTSTRPRP